MKLKKILTSLAVLTLIPSLSVPLTSHASSVASDGMHVSASAKPSSNTGYDWGMTLDTSGATYIIENGDSNPDNYSESGEVPGISEVVFDTNGVVRGCAITVLYTTDKNILQEIKSFCDPDGDGKADHGTADWMRDIANRKKLQVWEHADESGHYSQKCFYDLGAVSDNEPIMNDWYPVGVGKTSNAYNTSAYVSFGSSNDDKPFILHYPNFKSASGMSAYRWENKEFGGSKSTGSLWDNNIWEISARSSVFKGEKEEVIKAMWQNGVCDSETAAKNFFNEIMSAKGMSPNLIDTENFFFAFYIEPLIQVKISYNDGDRRIWSDPLLFTPTMMAEYAEFSQGSAFISSKGLYSWTNPDNFINRTLLSTGTRGTSGTATVNQVGEIEIKNANEVKLQNLVCQYGRGAYEVGAIVFKGEALDDLPNIPSVPVMKDRNAYNVDDTNIPNLAELEGAENLTLDGCATIDAETWAQVEEILKYALNHTSAIPTCAMYTQSDELFKDRVKKVRDVSMHAVESQDDSTGGKTYNQEYIAAYKTLLNTIAGTSDMRKSIEIPTNTTPTTDIKDVAFKKRSSNNNPNDYFDKHDESNANLGFGTTTTNMGVQEGEFSIAYSNIVMTHTPLDAVQYNFEISRGISTYTNEGAVEESGKMGNAVIQEVDGVVTYGDLLKRPYSYAIKYRLFNKSGEDVSFGEPTRPNVVILNEDTGETWDATISDGIWGNVKLLSDYMYAKEDDEHATIPGDGGYSANLPEYTVAGSEGLSSSNDWKVHAAAARENRKIINKIAPHITNYRDALNLINTYINSDGSIKANNYLKYTEELNANVGKLNWDYIYSNTWYYFEWSDYAGLAGQNNTGQGMRSTFYNKVEEMDSNLTSEMNIILDKLRGTPIKDEEVNGKTFPYGMITASGWNNSGSIAYSVNQFATDRFKNYASDANWGHIDTCGWWRSDGYANWKTSNIKDYYLYNNNINWRKVAVDHKYYEDDGKCGCMQNHLSHTSYDLIISSVNSDVNKNYPTLSQAVNADKNALKTLQDLLTAEIDKYEKAVKAFPINYACAYNLYADTYSDTWLVALNDPGNNENSVVKNDMTDNLTLRNTALDISVPSYKDEQGETKVYKQALMSVVINDRANSYSKVNGTFVLDADEYYVNYLDAYNISRDDVYPNGTDGPVVYIAHKDETLDVNNASVDELSKSYLKMESVTGNKSAKSLTTDLENPFKVRVVNSYTHDENAGSSKYRTGDALVRRSIYGLVNKPCWKDLSVASVLKDPYHYGIIINGWTSTSVNDIVYEWQQSKWQYQDDYDFTDLTRYILTNKSVILSDGHYTRYPVDKIDANDENVAVFYNSHIYKDSTHFPPLGVIYPIDAKTGSDSDKAGAYFVRWKGLSDTRTFSYLTTRNANKGYAPDYTHIYKDNNTGTGVLPTEKEWGISPEAYLVDGEEDHYNNPGYTTTSGITGTERILQMYIYRNMKDPNNPNDPGTAAYDKIDLAHTSVEYKYMPDLDNNHAEIQGNPSADYDPDDGTIVDLWGNQGKVPSRQVFGMTAASGDGIDRTQIDKRDDDPFVTASASGNTVFRPNVTNPTFAFMWVNAKTTHDISARFNLTMKYNSKVVLNTSYSTDAEDIQAMSDVPFVKAGQTIELRTEGIDTKDNFIEVEASCLVPKSSDKGIRSPELTGEHDVMFKSADAFKNAMDEFCNNIVSNAKVGVASTFNGINTHSGLGNCIANSPLKSSMYTSYNTDKKSGGSIDSTLFKTQADRNNLTAFEIVETDVETKNLVPSATAHLGETITVFKDGYAGKAQTALDSILYPSSTGSTASPTWYREYTDQYAVVTYKAKIKVTLNEFTAIISKYESDSLTDSDKLLHANDDTITKAWKTENVFGYRVPLQKVDGGTANAFISFIDLSGLDSNLAVISNINAAFAENSGETDTIKQWKLEGIPKYLVGQQTSVHVRGSIYDNT